MGLGTDGGMAASVLVPSTRLLVPLGNLEPWRAAPLADAGLTPYHAIAGCRAELSEGSTALVIGVGGLGHLAVQLLRALTKCRVLATDTRPAALALAEAAGADQAVGAGPAAAGQIRAATGGRGVDAVFDFVGAAPTLALATEVLRAAGELVIVGSGGGRLTVTKPAALPAGARISLPYWGSRPELAAVLDLARRGLLRVEAEQYPLDRAPEVFARLRAGTIRGRAVLIPS
jgi:propanol-preferring alcohol dehydrogenase